MREARLAYLREIYVGWVLILVGVIRLGTTDLQPMQLSQSPSLLLCLQLVTRHLFIFSSRTGGVPLSSVRLVAGGTVHP